MLMVLIGLAVLVCFASAAFVLVSAIRFWPQIRNRE